MDKLFETFIETVTDKVMERLMTTEKMKLFLSGVKDEPVQASDIEGLNAFMRVAVEDAMDDFSVKASDVVGLDDEIESKVSALLKDATVSIDI